MPAAFDVPAAEPGPDLGVDLVAPSTTALAEPSFVAEPAHDTALTPAGIATATSPLVASQHLSAGATAAQESSAVISPSSIVSYEVASPAPVDEDDWEWTIALARARVAAEETQSPRRRAPSSAVPTAPHRVTSRPAVVREPTSATGDWPATAPIGSIDYEDYRVATRPAIPLPAVPTAGVRPAPTTVIPVPPLPSLETTMHVRLEPVVRTAHAAPPTARLAKGTGPVDPDHAVSRRHASMLIDEATANLGVGDRTRPGVAVAAAQARRAATMPGTSAPASGDHTKPGIALPSVARAVALPSTKRRNVPR